jgi:anthranilate synthase component 1
VEQARFRELRVELSPPEAFRRLLPLSDHAYLLESVVGPAQLAGYSFIGFAPTRIVTADPGKLRVDEQGQRTVFHEAEDPLVRLRSLIRPIAVQANRPRLVGGAVGYFSYDAIRYWERLPARSAAPEPFPRMEFGIYEDGLTFDHVQGQTYYYTTSEDRSERVLELLRTPPERGAFALEEPRSNLDQPHFEEAVGRAKDYILAGEVFQVVLSRRYEFQIRGDLFGFYEALRRINPSPYMYYLKLGPRCIVGASPEMLVRVEGAQLETYPIAGTRPWTRDAEANAALTQELLRDPKDAAEHVMLVDLARNDVGRVAEYGSVSVPEYRVPHRFSHVQHLVSRVIGRLSPGVTAFDVLRALFPAGTVSGAPKVRAMEIIDELEPCRRGPYAGAVGYFSRTGSADFAITIRTLVASSGHASIQVGAGIVADSVPEHEWQETEHKAGALLTALQKART